MMFADASFFVMIRLPTPDIDFFHADADIITPARLICYRLSPDDFRYFFD